MARYHHPSVLLIFFPLFRNHPSTKLKLFQKQYVVCSNQPLTEMCHSSDQIFLSHDMILTKTLLSHVPQVRLWIQVLRELRRGVQLKKVCHTRNPIEYQMTPYEILMDDIRSRRYKLKQVTVDGSIPPRVKKDAHAIILEFIRSRPPLRKVSILYISFSEGYK